jgi:hypothetical protein
VVVVVFVASIAHTRASHHQTHKEFYNVIGRRIDERLEKLGAARFHTRGEGDDAGV